MRTTYMTPQRKEEAKKFFMLTAQRAVACDKTILDVLDIALSVMQDFNGKVINKRLIDAINAKIAEKQPNIHNEIFVTKYTVSFDGNSYRNDIRFSTFGLQRWIPDLKASCPDITYHLPIPQTNERLDMFSDFQIEAIQKLQDQIHEHIKDLEHCMDTWEHWYEKTAELEKLVNEFNDYDGIGRPIRFWNMKGFCRFDITYNY